MTANQFQQDFKLTEKYQTGLSFMDMAKVVKPLGSLCAANKLINLAEDMELKLMNDLQLKRQVSEWADCFTFTDNTPWLIGQGFIQRNCLLNPCKNCGNQVKLYNCGEWVGSGNSNSVPLIGCSTRERGCGLSVPAQELEKAVAIWNRDIDRYTHLMGKV